MPNRLADADSLYLRQHADHPVDWWPWGTDALAEAERRGVPLIVSVGYSACHWCHVMARESFADPSIARLMNEHFVCIKVDREEHPDVDHVYMESVQMITQRGGWPLNVFCLPDGRPFFGGTYFPPEDRGQGMVPWPQLLMRISDYYRKNRDELVENAGNIMKNLAATNDPVDPDSGPLDGDTLLLAAEGICSQHDDDWGGFGDAPKFPPAMTLDFLLAVRGTQACESRPHMAQRIDEVAGKTLSAMACGGIFDQIGGGFARYSVDQAWTIPHFEKMLYDNGLLLDIFAKGWLRYRDPFYRAVAEETVDWLEREMQAPGGAWYAALDADSEGIEGKYYVWTPEEIASVLGPEASAFCDAYHVTDAGNFDHGTTNPVFVYDSFSRRTALARSRERLRAARAQRPPPHRDNKILLAWNCLVIRGLAEAAFAFNRPDWFLRAANAVDWLWNSLVRPTNMCVSLFSVYYEGSGARHPGRLDDYAYLAEALLALSAKADWVQPGTAARYQARAVLLLNAITAHFADPDGPGCYTTAHQASNVIARKKAWFDNATPAGNSSLVNVYAALHALTGEPMHAEALASLRPAYATVARRAPAAVAHALAGFTRAATGIPVIKIRGHLDLGPLRDAIVERPWRPVFLRITASADQPRGYQLCVGEQCLPPTSNPAEIAVRL